MKEDSRPVRREGPQHRCQDAFIRRARAATFPVNGEGDDNRFQGKRRLALRRWEGVSESAAPERRVQGTAPAE